ncbi:MAG: hypothetical protein MHM6MM_001607 [Cercozoa sp. M6MM]
MSKKRNMPVSDENERPPQRARTADAQDASVPKPLLRWLDDCDESSFAIGIDEQRFGETETGTEEVKLALCDMDWTLVKPASGRKFAINASDWQFLVPEVPQVLGKLHNDGFRVVLITNQAGVSKGKRTVSDVKKQIDSVARAVRKTCASFTLDALVSFRKNRWRKPHPHLVLRYLNRIGAKRVHRDSFVCGDAAGRVALNRKVKRDFGVGDRCLAHNLGLRFVVPEQLFCKEVDTREFDWRCFNSAEFLESCGRSVPQLHANNWLRLYANESACENESESESESENESESESETDSEKREMVLIVAAPASGKSSFVRRRFPEHVRANNDDQGTSECKRIVKQALSDGANIVIDNTNGRANARKYWIQLAKKHGYTVRCVWITTSKPLSMHLTLLRESMGLRNRLPPVALHSYHKYFDEPSLEEGFHSLQKLNFAPHFSDADAVQKHLFACRFVE